MKGGGMEWKGGMEKERKKEKETQSPYTHTPPYIAWKERNEKGQRNCFT